jgi:hypothetical protein
MGRAALLARGKVDHDAIERDVEVAGDEQDAARVSGKRVVVKLHDDAPDSRG